MNLQQAKELFCLNLLTEPTAQLTLQLGLDGYEVYFTLIGAEERQPLTTARGAVRVFRRMETLTAVLWDLGFKSYLVKR